MSGKVSQEIFLRSPEGRLVEYIRQNWKLPYGTREIRLRIEYQDGVPVLIRVVRNFVVEEKLK